MNSIIYVPKTPISIPLFNTDTKSYTVYFEDGEAEIPAELFFKIFRQSEQIEKPKKVEEGPKPSISETIHNMYSKEEIDAETKQIHERMRSQVRMAKMFGVTKEIFIRDITNSAQMRESFPDKPTFDFFLSLTNQIWDEVESKN